MKKLILNIFLIFLIVFISACLGNISQLNHAKIRYNLPILDSSQVRYISGISSISFEWDMIRNPAVVGYSIYRSTVNDKELRKVATINDRYSTHYVDKI